MTQNRKKGGPQPMPEDDLTQLPRLQLRTVETSERARGVRRPVQHADLSSAAIQPRRTLH